MKLATLVFVMLLTIPMIVFGQCPKGIPPATDIVGRSFESNIQKVSDPVFELRRGSNGMNYFQFLADGRLVFRGVGIRPNGEFYAASAAKLSFYGPWFEKYLVARSPFDSSLRSVLIFDQSNCIGREASIPPLQIKGIVLRKGKQSKNYLCGADGIHYIEIAANANRGFLKARSTQVNPCGESIPASGREERISRTLKGAIAEALGLLKARKFETFLKFYTVQYSPAFVKKNKVTNWVEPPITNQRIQEFKDRFADQVIVWLREISPLTPEFEKNGETARFRLPNPQSPFTDLAFMHIDGFWYICEHC